MSEWKKICLVSDIPVLGSRCVSREQGMDVAVFRNDPEVIAFGARALRCQCAVFPLCGVIVISSMLTQTINKVWQASVLAVARQGLFFIPAVLALPHIWGELGVQLAQPVSDVCAFALTVPLVLGVLRDMDRQQRLEKIR